MSEIVFQLFLATVPKYVVNELEKILLYLKAFVWNNSTPKIKHETLCNDYKAGGLKNVDIPNKIIALQWSCIRRLYDDSFHEWKLILLYLIEKSFGTSFKFHLNLLFKSNKTKFSPPFYRKIILNWKKHLLVMMAEIPSSYCLNIGGTKVDKASIHFLTFSEKSINYISQLFSDNGSIKK